MNSRFLYLIRNLKKFVLILFGTILLPLLLSYNTVSASSHNYDFFSFNFQAVNNNEFVYSGQKGYNQLSTYIHSINRVAASVSGIGNVPSDSNYLVVSAKFNMVTFTDTGLSSYLPDTSDTPYISDVAINGNGVPFESASINVYKTDWNCDPLDAGVGNLCRTFTFEFTFIVKDLPSTINDLAFACTYGNGFFTGYRDGFNNYFEYDINNNANVDFAFDYNTALIQQQIQLQQLTINSINDINDSLQQQINQDKQDREDLQDESDNASDTSDDLSDDVTNASSSLLVIIGNFVNIVLNPPQSDCNITLDVGNANFGQADLCRLSLPQPLAVLGTLFILGFIITFAVSLIMTFLSLLKGATQG